MKPVTQEEAERDHDRSDRTPRQRPGRRPHLIVAIQMSPSLAPRAMKM
jgi:hypothetical protein